MGVGRKTWWKLKIWYISNYANIISQGAEQRLRQIHVNLLFKICRDGTLQPPHGADLDKLLWTKLPLNKGQDFLTAQDKWNFPDPNKTKKPFHKKESLLHLLLILYGFCLCLPSRINKSQSWCYAFTDSGEKGFLAIPAILSNACKGEEIDDWLIPTASWWVGIHVMEQNSSW